VFHLNDKYLHLPDCAISKQADKSCNICMEMESYQPLADAQTCDSRL
jgi:hypothetical protein